MEVTGNSQNQDQVYYLCSEVLLVNVEEGWKLCKGSELEQNQMLNNAT